MVAFVEPEGWLVTRFVEGATPSVERMREPEMLARVAAALRAFHEGPPISGSFDSFRVVESVPRDRARARRDGPARVRAAHELAARIDGSAVERSAKPCHNDLLNANFLWDDERLCIVDWEYAGMGDPFFDLANFSINHELDEDARRLLLEAYFGGVRAEDARALELMRFMSDFREAMWGVVQTAVSELDFDFAAYASEHFERLERTAAEPSFRAALERADTREAPSGASRCTRCRVLDRPRTCFGRKLEARPLLLLEPLELLLRAHAHRSLEPVLGGEDPPAAEEQQMLHRRGAARSSPPPR